MQKQMELFVKKFKKMRNKGIIIYAICFNVLNVYAENVSNYVNKKDVENVKKIFFFQAPKQKELKIENDGNKKNKDGKDVDEIKKEDKNKDEKIVEVIDEMVLKNRKAKEIVEKIEGFGGYKFIGIDNKIIFSGDKKKLEEIKKILQSLDVKKEQVLIKGTIIDTSSNLFEKLGIQWESNEIKKGVSNPNFFSKFLNGELSIGGILKNGGYFLGIDFNFLKENGDIRIESMPTLLIAEGEEGELRVTEEVLIGEKKITKNNTEYSEPIFSEAGIVFKISPEVIKNKDKKKINLKIETEVSNFKLTSNYSENSGAKQKNQTKTSIILDDGGTTFIGGLKQNVEKNTMRKVPFLSDIPLIGPLFKYKRNNKENRDIYLEIEAIVQ